MARTENGEAAAESSAQGASGEALTVCRPARADELTDPTWRIAGTVGARLGAYMKWLIGTLVGLIVIGSAQAQRTADNNTVTVQDLYQECRATGAGAEAFKLGLCTGYIAGVGDMYLASCRRVISYGAMVQAFENWAPAHPQDWSKPQAEGVMAALSSVWSCGKSPW